MRLSSLCRDRFNQIKPLSQSRVIWNLNFKSHTWTHFCFKAQTRSAKAEPNESFLRVHEHRFSGAVSSLPYISQYWKMSSRLVFLEGCCAVWREIKWCLISSSFYYFFRNSNGRATALKPPKILAKYSTVVLVRKLSNSRPRKTTPKLCFFSLMRFFFSRPRHDYDLEARNYLPMKWIMTLKRKKFPTSVSRGCVCFSIYVH